MSVSSGTPEQLTRIRREVIVALRREPMASDPALRAPRQTKVGAPVLVRQPEGDPAFWLVPLAVRHQAWGFARVELSERVAQIGCFGSGSHDEASWLEASFFRRAPPRALAEVRARYGEAALAKPVLSYDGSPARWGWRLAIARPDGSTVVYITPGGWYEQQIRGGPNNDRE